VIRQLRFKMKAGRWSTTISKRHPDATFDVISWIGWNEVSSLAVIRVYPCKTLDMVKEIQKLDDVLSVEGRIVEGSVLELHVIHRDASLQVVFRDFGVAQRPTMRFCNGECAFEIIGTEESIDNMMTELRQRSLPVRVDPTYRYSRTFGPVEHPLVEETKTRSAAGVKKGSGHLAVCRLRFTVPRSDWIGSMSEKHPGTSVDVMGYSILEDRIIMDLRVNSTEVGDWADYLRKVPGMIDVRPLGHPQKANSLRVVYSGYEMTTAVFRLHLILRTPFTITDGTGVVVVAGPEEIIRHAIKMFPSLRLQVERVYTTERDEHPLLTPRQADIFNRAMAAGYFEVPRRVTLTELASRFGVAISTLSEMLAIIEKKLLQEALGSRTR